MHLLLEIQIDYDFETQLLQLSQTRCIIESLSCYHVPNSKRHCTPLSSGVKLTKADCPTQPEEVMAIKQY